MKQALTLSITLIILGLLVLTACTQNQTPTRSTLTGVQEITSVSQLKAFLEENQASSENSLRGGTPMKTAAMDSVMESAPMPMAAPVANTASSQGTASSNGASDYSTTNVQVAGIDEPDFLKNDNKYLYLIKNKQLYIIDAYPAREARILTNLSLEDYANTLLLDGDTLVIIASSSDQVKAISPYSYEPYQRYRPLTKVTLYDITDKKKPEVVKEYRVSGSYRDARLTAHKLYLLTNEGISYYDAEPTMPVITAADTIVKPRIIAFPNPERSYQYTTVARIDLTNEKLEAESYLTGYTNTVYMSHDALYFSYRKNKPWRWYDEERQEKFWKVVVPLLPEDVQTKIRAIGKREEDWPRIGQVLMKMYDGMSKEQAEALRKRISRAISEWDAKRALEDDQTIIQKVDISDGLEYVGGAIVPGRLLNQFSMDERDGELRVATTTRFWTRDGSNSWSNVYVLDEQMNLKGKLEKLAPDEEIKSARFIGDRLYLVTFERTDPLFVISLDGTPRVLGELNMTGYSSYLHPYKNHYLIGVGFEASENQWGGVTNQGIKLALYDVSDVQHPKQVDVVTIGDAGSRSEASRDHHAFLLDERRGILVLPVQEVTKNVEWVDEYHYRRYRVWYGAYVYDVSEDGFRLRGKVSQFNGESREQWWSPYNVKRSVLMDDTLYTVSNANIVMSSLDTLEKLNELTLKRVIDYKPTPVPMVRTN